MKAIKVIEKLLMRDCAVKERQDSFDSCIVCTSTMLWRISSLFPESYIVANSAAQVFPNLASVYYAVKELKVPLIAVAGTTSFDFETFLNLTFQAAEFELKLLKKVYEENGEILLPLYGENRSQLNAALMEMNIDVQIEKLLSLNEFKEPVEAGELFVCGLVLDENGIYGDKPNFYLINFNGIKDPEEIRNHDLLKEIPESVRKRKVKRIHLQL